MPLQRHLETCELMLPPQPVWSLFLWQHAATEMSPTLCNGAMNKTTKCQPAGDADSVSSNRLQGKGRGESSAEAAHAEIWRGQCGPEDRPNPAHPPQVVRNSNWQQEDLACYVCAAFLMGPSCGWRALSCCQKIWKAVLWQVCQMPIRVETYFWELGCSLLPSSNSWIQFCLFSEDYLDVFL